MRRCLETLVFREEALERANYHNDKCYDTILAYSRPNQDGTLALTIEIVEALLIHGTTPCGNAGNSVATQLWAINRPSLTVIIIQYYAQQLMQPVSVHV